MLTKLNPGIISPIENKLWVFVMCYNINFFFSWRVIVDKNKAKNASVNVGLFK